MTTSVSLFFFSRHWDRHAIFQMLDDWLNASLAALVESAQCCFTAHVTLVEQGTASKYPNTPARHRLRAHIAQNTDIIYSYSLLHSAHQGPKAQRSAITNLNSHLHVATAADTSAYKSSPLFQPHPSPHSQLQPCMSLTHPHSHPQLHNTNAVCCPDNTLPLCWSLCFPRHVKLSRHQPGVAPHLLVRDPLKDGPVYPTQDRLLAPSSIRDA